MTQERIQTQYRLGGPFANQAELAQAIALAIEAHKRDFFPLLERLVDEGNPGVHLSQEHPPRVLGIELDQSGIQGLAQLGYESNFFEGCLIVDKYDQHQIDLPFCLEGDQLTFDIELPIAWNFNN
ncbi:hypothetical protein [Aeromonas media]|jgi:hypothetical protein|uniref:Uncharacterized protein n=1 Tax=Aeromonas media TaxID=651 RepID=A0AAE7AMN6_AERME|nr:hypothetical protein [Aeromonas media]MBS4640481.1 hypothetical protein [Aeromonas media]MCV3290072.1 hypothetical protein [Aeromonas media]QJT32216.1 hypothetical protein E4186_20055 [Aeromonas media]QJT33314.1 hypothetical protein E4187_02275 [Aeromonas media]QJT38890.1 hypothetical protein E4188_10410 [Aeromonas media]